MRILFTGELGAYVPDMIPAMQREGHSVSLLGEWTPSRDEASDVSCYRMDPSEEYAQRMVEIARFDVIVFFYALSSEGIGEDTARRGAMLDALWALATTAKRSGLKQFILVTDRRVFGSGQSGLEDEQPVPDTSAGVMNSAAEDCVNCCSQGDYTSLIVRVDSLYAPRWEGSLLYELMEHGDGRDIYAMPCAAEAPCGFLRASDLSEFLCIAIEDGLSGAVHVAGDAPCDYGTVVERVSELEPKLRVSWAVKPTSAVSLLSGRTEALGWLPERRWDEDLRELSPRTQSDMKYTIKRKLLGASKTIGRFTLIALLAVILHFVIVPQNGVFALPGILAWLVYVACAGVIGGLWTGMTAAALACGSYLIWLSRAGHSLGEMLSVSEGWPPLLAYTLAGAMFGALSAVIGGRFSKTRREKERREEESALRELALRQADEELQRLEKEPKAASDSYGRIYGIARELDSLQPQQVLLSALDVIEDVLESTRVAIFYVKPGDRYARLALNSRGMWLPRSLTLDEIDGLAEAIQSGVTYTRDEGAPALVVPIKYENATVAMIALWEKPDKALKPYYQNLFDITCGLVESAMARAMYRLRYASDVYLSDTHMLTEKHFLLALEAFRKIKRLGRGDFLLLQVECEDTLSIVEFDSRLGAVMRATDISGRMGDGTVLALLPQAEKEHYSRIAARFAQHGMLCTPRDI